MAYYKDLRHYVEVLESRGKLIRITAEINKDTELHPLVRWQYRGLPEKDRKAFLFENTTDIKGRKYSIPVLVAAHAGSREIYAMAMMCKTNEIMNTWQKAQLHPIEPRMVESGPVQEVVHMGANLLEKGGLEEFPIPISTPGFDNAPYLTAANWVSRDPETGIRNVGNYRGMVKDKLKVGCASTPPKHLWNHRKKHKDMGKSVMPAAVFIGSTPNIGLVATASIPYGVDEFAVAGGIAGEPVELVKCKTVDIEVPANAEIVIEGEIPTDYLEVEAPFGEHAGYMGLQKNNPFLNVTCITHRKNPIWCAYLSQFPPSESSVLRGVAADATYYKFLKKDIGIPSIVDVAFHEDSGAWQWCVISLKSPRTPDVWRALNGAVAFSPEQAKIVIAVDDDIDPRDPDSVIWALSYRMQPLKDIRITHGKEAALDPSAAPPDEIQETAKHAAPTSAILIDATRKWDYPPLSLPKKEYMEHAKEIWEKLGLPPLTPKVPWFGYSLGFWTKELEEEAELALKGEHYKTGQKQAERRVEG